MRQAQTEPLWTLDIPGHRRLKALDPDAWAEWNAWWKTYHPLVWEICDFGDTWVLRCRACEEDPNGGQRLVVVRDDDGRPPKTVQEDLVVPAPPAELVARTRRLLDPQPDA